VVSAAAINGNCTMGSAQCAAVKHVVMSAAFGGCCTFCGVVDAVCTRIAAVQHVVLSAVIDGDYTLSSAQ
jgi:hypothetical protein